MSKDECVCLLYTCFASTRRSATRACSTYSPCIHASASQETRILIFRSCSQELQNFRVSFRCPEALFLSRGVTCRRKYSVWRAISVDGGRLEAERRGARPVYAERWREIGRHGRHRRAARSVDGGEAQSNV